VDRALSEPIVRSEDRKRVAADLFYCPGGATRRSVEALCELMALEPAPAVLTGQEAPCLPSA
jgi:hypothetical protein